MKPLKLLHIHLHVRVNYVYKAIYNVLPELWLRKCLSGIFFISTNMPENRIRIIKCKQELEVLTDDGTDIYVPNVIDIYMDHQKFVKSAFLKNTCLTRFARSRITSENHYLPDILEEDIDEKNNDFAKEVPKTH